MQSIIWQDGFVESAAVVTKDAAVLRTTDLARACLRPRLSCSTHSGPPWQVPLLGPASSANASSRFPCSRGHCSPGAWRVGTAHRRSLVRSSARCRGSSTTAMETTLRELGQDIVEADSTAAFWASEAAATGRISQVAQEPVHVAGRLDIETARYLRQAAAKICRLFVCAGL